MKHINTFNESIKDKPQIGDWVITIDNYIGQIIEIGEVYYKVKQDNIRWLYTKKQILFFSPNKEDLQTYLTQQKYNL